MKPLSFLGHIGCGKSTWAQAITEYCGLSLVKENLQDIHFLPYFWREQRYAFHTQVGFYLEWWKLYNDAMWQKQCLIDSSIISHHLIFSTYMFEHQILDIYEFAMCKNLYEMIVCETSVNTVYLHCDMEVLKQRIKKRNRKDELHSSQYLSELQALYWKAQKKYNLPIIDISHLSPYNEKDVGSVVTLLKKVTFL